jgi:putative ABC transport system permease protein
MGYTRTMKLRSFSGLSARGLGSRLQRTLLTAVGIVLGVGIVFGVLTLSETMSGTFTTLFSRAYGAADITVTAAGGSGTFDEDVLKKIRDEPLVKSAAPRLALPASLIEPRRNAPPEVRTMNLFGVERETAPLATGFELIEGRFPREGAEVTLDESSAEDAGLEVGDEVTLATPDGQEELEVVGLLRIPGGSFGGRVFGMAPLPFAQRAFDEPGRISGIAVEAGSEGEVGELRRKLRRSLGDEFEAERSETRTEQITQQFRVFELSLLFFAGTALFVGAYLVFNALSMTVLERTRELGMLRALGSTRTMIARSVVLEALLLGVLGSLAGVLFGYGMARGLVYLFGKAYLFEITTITPSPFAFVAALSVGVLVTVLAALYPALRAGRVSPVEAMRARAAPGKRSRPSRLTLLLAVPLTAGGAYWTYYLAKNLSGDLGGLIYTSGIVGIICTFFGVSLAVPHLVSPLAALFSPVLRSLFGIEGRMAAANATRNRGRTALTASALMVGVALVVAFSALGGSVLGSIRAYLEDSLGADYAIQPENQNSGVDYSQEMAQRIGDLRGVEATTGVVSTFRRDGDETTLVFGVDASFPKIFRVDDTGGRDPFQRVQRGEALVGEQLAGTRGLEAGSEIELPTPTGRREYRVAGVLKNDALGFGSGVYLSRETLARDFNEKDGELLAVKAVPGTDREALSRRIRDVLEDYPQFTLYSNAGWKAQIERDFNRQYVFFYAIMGVSVVVSAFGVVNTLSMSVFERTREIGVLRAIGTTRMQIGRLIVDEGVVISLIGCLVGVAVGSLLGYLFVRGSGAGGFDVSFYYPKLPALASLFSGLLIGLLAGLLPARTAARKSIVEAVQYE